MILILSIIASVIPTICYIGVIYWVDQYEKEPLWLLAAAFIWGAIPSIVIALIANTTLSLPFYLFSAEDTVDFFTGFLIAPPVEESIKGAALLGILFFQRHQIDSPLDGIIYGAMVGIGFAMVENVVYFMAQFEAGGFTAWGINIFFRAGVFGLNHALFTAMTGLGIAVSHLSTRRALRLSAPVLGWMVAVALHAFHNLGASLGGVFCFVTPLAAWGGVMITLVIIVWSLYQERLWMQEHLKMEVAVGTLTLRQYEIASSWQMRISHLVGILQRDGYRQFRRTSRFFQLCARLAYRKRHQLRHPNEVVKVDGIRDEIVRLGRDRLV